MAWSATAGSVTASNEGDTRTLEFVDIVLTTDGEYDFSPDFEDPEDYEPVQLGDVTLAVQHGGQLAPLR